MKLFRLFVLYLAAFPLLLLAAFYNYVLMARLYLGHWPQYNRPDPKRLGWWIPHDLLWLGLICFPAIAILAMCLAAVGRFRSKEFPIWITLATIAGSLATLFACLRIDPGGFFEWFAD